MKKEEYEKMKHELRMEELIYIRETEKLKHAWELERGRIKSAEIRKNIERKREYCQYHLFLHQSLNI